MNSGSSALISTGGQSAETFSSSSCSHTSRPGVHGTGLPVRRTTSTRDVVRRNLGERRVGVLFQRHDLAAADALVRGDDELRARVLDAAREAVRREAAEHHRVHGADARARQHGVGGLRDHRQVDRYAVALLDAMRLQDVGELRDALVQLPVGDLLVLGRIVALPDDGDLIAARGEMPVDAVGGDVERAVLEPFDRHVRRPEGRVLDARVGLDPVDALADLAPERVGVGDRAVVEALIPLRVDPGAGRPVRRHRIERFRHGLSSLDLLWLDYGGRGCGPQFRNSTNQAPIRPITAPCSRSTPSQWPPSITVSAGLAPWKALLTESVVMTKPSHMKAAVITPVLKVTSPGAM